MATPGPGLFPRWSDTAFRLALLGLAAFATLLIVGPWIYVRTPYNQNRSFQVPQPVQFDHRHHVQDDGIECLYCHSEAEHSSSAGVPSTELCMGCHSQVWNRSPMLAPVRASFFQDRPLEWNRVHDLPDFVFFDHSVHVRGGVQCQQCHGDVASMPLVHKDKSLTMGFCLDCHHDPETHVKGYDGPKLSAPIWQAHPGTTDRDSHVLSNKLLTCSACHH
jgi:hypothetical protein